MVTYIERYKDANKKPALLPFEIGKNVAVHAITGKPNLSKWRGNIDFDEDCLVTK